MEAARRHLSRQLCRLVLGARRGLSTTRARPTSAPTACGARPQGTPVEWVEEESYFFRLSAYQDRLLALYDEHPDFIGPESGGTRSSSFVKGGLQDLSISRTTFDWGIPVPGDPKHVMYVWVDALTNYITGVGFPDESAPLLALLAGRRARHRQGHRALPRGLLAGLPDVGRHRAAEARLRPRLPVQPRGEDVEVGRQRRRPVRARSTTYGVDQVRYFFLREVPFGQDGNYSHEAIVNRINADLANDLGNLAQRSLSMIAQELRRRAAAARRLHADGPGLLAAADALLGKAAGDARWTTSQCTMRSNAIWAVVADANRYFAAAASPGS